MKRKKIIISVTNDVATDQRVNRAAVTLADHFDVLIVGRKLKNSLPVDSAVKIKRFSLFFNKGPFFYAEYSIRLFFFLLFNKFELLLSNDLDTLLPNYLVSKMKNKQLIYDSHELFTEVPELQNRKIVKKIWLAIEGFVFPELKHCYTVNTSIAKIYEEKYKVKMDVVRNVPFAMAIEQKSRKELNLPENKKIIIFQGTGININRGAEEALLSMKYTADDVMLLFIGGGDVFEDLKRAAKTEMLEHKILFIPRVPVNVLRQYTAHASIGLSLDKDTNLNYKYSLPNKLFDYIQAGVPVLVSNLPEVRQVVEVYNIGHIVDSHSPHVIGKAIMDMLNSPDYTIWKNNTIIASAELNWEKEKKKLLKIFNLE